MEEMGAGIHLRTGLYIANGWRQLGLSNTPKGTGASKRVQVLVAEVGCRWNPDHTIHVEIRALANTIRGNQIAGDGKSDD